METTYDSLDHTIDVAKSLHRLTRDPLLLSAIQLLTPYLSCDNPDSIHLRRQATIAYNVTHTLDAHRVALFP